jgi:hypothetical protein
MTLEEKKSKVSKSSRYKVTGVAAVMAVIVVIAVYLSDNPSKPVNPIQGVECDPLEGTVFHVHAHLDIFVDSQSVTIPAGIGIKQNECLYWLHTHNTSGVIHIESPTKMTFTLAQFIEVWDNTPNISPTFEELTHNDQNLKVFVNGTEINGTFAEIPISAHDEIVIVAGNVPPTMPSSYEFGGL